jgi:hypothetical protein
MSSTDTTDEQPQFTHIPIVYRSEESDKYYGTIVLEGAITDTQINELRANCRDAAKISKLRDVV